MNTLQTSDPGHPRLLRCDTVNAAGEAAVRFVELEYYRLWEYMMRQEHGIEVRHLRLCLWLGETTFMRNAGPYSHGGEVEDVNRITLSIFDRQHSYFLHVKRYVLAEESQLMEGVLLSHVPDDIQASGDMEIEVTAGICVGHDIAEPSLELVLGLSGFDESPQKAMRSQRGGFFGRWSLT